MKNEFVNIGDRPINDGNTFSCDHITAKFEIVIRSLGGVGVTDLKDLIERKFEVVSIEQIDQKIMVKR